MLHIDVSPEGVAVFANFVSGLPEIDYYSPRDRGIRRLVPQGAECRFSTDGKWLAYNSKLVIYVQPFPGPGGRIQISSSAGAQPVWSRDGRHLFYIALDKKLMEVDFDPRTATASAPRVLFQTRILPPTYVGTQYDVSPRGEFLVNSVPAEHSAPITMLSNWTSAVEKR